jgi:Ca-activated chloride channel family protein
MQQLSLTTETQRHKENAYQGWFFPRFLSVSVSFWLIASVPFAVAQNAPGSTAKDYRVSVDVDLVIFNVTVTDSKGHLVKGLSKSDFRVVEAGQEQDIQFVRPEDTPATVGMVIDNSGSMRRKRSDVIGAALAFVESSNPQDELFIVNFNERVSMGLGGTPFTSDIDQLRGALANTRAEGKTALYDAVATALKHLEAGTLQRKALVILSDGGDNASGQTENGVLAMAEQSNATIYTIDIDDPDDKDQNPKVLQELAKLTGGEAYQPKTLDELPDVWRKIAGGIRSQYTIGYVSKNRTHDGTFRSVKVTAAGKDGKPLRVRARRGYVAPGTETGK